MIVKWLKEYFRTEPKTWFTSDLHIGHNNIIQYCNRQFPNKEEMNEYIIRVWNKTVKPFDIIFVIGDFALNHNKAFEVAKRLNGRIFLVAGNHDQCFIANKKYEEFTKKYLNNGFYWVYPHKTNLTLTNGLEVLLSHLPYLKEGMDQRYKQFRPQDEGKILLCGHEHGRFVKKDRMIDVGFDAHWKLLSEDDILAIINDPREYIPSRLTKFYEERIKVSKDNAEEY